MGHPFIELCVVSRSLGVRRGKAVNFYVNEILKKGESQAAFDGEGTAVSETFNPHHIWGVGRWGWKAEPYVAKVCVKFLCSHHNNNAFIKQISLANT